MSNISETGVRLELDRPPPEGATVLLQWRAHEQFCKVIWANEDSCGLAFERPIPRDVFLDTTGQEDEPGGPVANPRNISLGKKRSRMQITG